MSKKVRYISQTRLPATVCPACLTVSDAATGFNESAGVVPKPGGISICNNCFLLGTYDEAMQIRKMTAQEYADLQQSSRWLEIQAMILHFKTRRKK